ncbi:MAG: NADH-quinone oxidoreductase subunit M [Thermoflexales bacterium]|nr:NADH-quinone oxidoreductase subunit M [Thermoflexales bacterium]
MNNLGFPILTAITFLPTLGALGVLTIPAGRERDIKLVTLGSSLLALALSLGLLVYFRWDVAELQFVNRMAWVPGLGIQYFLGLDGISLWLVLLTTLIVPLAILSAWNAVHERLKEFMIFMLLLETGMLGVFLTLDLFLFYIFWEFTLVPMYFLIGIWGGPRRVYAAVKFFLYTMAGSLLMLLSIIALWLSYAAQHNGLGSFDLTQLVPLASALPPATQMALFLGFAAAFAVKVPLWPLHSWLPDAHVEAPTAGSVILAGILLKMGCYGFLRFNLPLFPHASQQAAPYIAVLAVVGILYGAMVSFAQTDVKKLVAYSSVSHLGFVMLGIFSLTRLGIQGAILQMVNHGLSTGALFLLVGMIYERKHTREMEAFGGLMKLMPAYGALSLIVVLSSMGLPGLNGFVGEFTILLGSFGASPEVLRPVPWIYTAFAASGVILAAVYLLTMFQKVYLGEVKPANHGLQDLSTRELVVLAPIVLLIVLIGLYPAPFFGAMNAAVSSLVVR